MWACVGTGQAHHADGAKRRLRGFDRLLEGGSVRRVGLQRDGLDAESLERLLLLLRLLLLE